MKNLFIILATILLVSCSAEAPKTEEIALDTVVVTTNTVVTDSVSVDTNTVVTGTVTK